MRILHVITGIQKAAGTSVFCCEVANGLVAAGHEVTIAVDNPNCKDHYPLDPRVKLIPLASLFQSTNLQPPTTNHHDLVHIHALWLPILHKVSNLAHKNKIPVVWSTHGMTAPWSIRHKWWKKMSAWWIYQKWDLKRAAAIHCTTEQEGEWNKSLGFKNCVVAPLGTHLPPSRSPTHNSNHTHTLLFVGRIYPVKGLVNLIKAWKIINTSLSNSKSKLELNFHPSRWKLRIVGPDQAGHLASLKSEVRRLGLESSVEFPGPKFGEELGQEYDNCDCFVLPSFTENFGATVVDAMAHGKPCIASTFTPWKELEEFRCGWWVSNEPESLAKAMQEMINAVDVVRCEMGERARRLVEVKYTWCAVVKKMIDVYGIMLAIGGGRK